MEKGFCAAAFRILQKTLIFKIILHEKFLIKKKKKQIRLF